MSEDRYRVQSIPLSEEAAEGLRNTILDQAPVLDDALEVVEDDEWDPDQAELREGETRDDDVHARRNAEMLETAKEVLGDDV